MYTEEQLVMISALQHLVFCRRQCALIHIEQVWSENRLTVLGELLHEKVHSGTVERRGDVRIARSLKLVSYRLGLVGQTDVVEFHRVSPSSHAGPGVVLLGVEGLWRPYPVEYKKGRPKKGLEDAVQLCAQALCLEEQLNTRIEEGALFYGEKRRRHTVDFSQELRLHTENLAFQLHEMIDGGKTPPPESGPKCKNCSLRDDCNPKWMGTISRKRYERMLFETEP